MAWNPTLNVFDPRLIGANLFAWFAENQADALVWANDGAEIGGAKDVLIRDFFLNARTPTRYPVCMLERIGFDTKTNEDIATIEIVVQYSIQLVHGNQDWLAANAPKYAMAFESMAKNIPETRLSENSKIVFNSEVLASAETIFTFLGTNGSQFMQEFTTTINWETDFSNYTG